jgi:hypothetical protein
LVPSGLQVLKDQSGLKVQPARKDLRDRKEYKDHKVSKVLLGLLALVMLILHPVAISALQITHHR